MLPYMAYMDPMGTDPFQMWKANVPGIHGDPIHFVAHLSGEFRHVDSPDFLPDWPMGGPMPRNPVGVRCSPQLVSG